MMLCLLLLGNSSKCHGPHTHWKPCAVASSSDGAKRKSVISLLGMQEIIFFKLFVHLVNGPHSLTHSPIPIPPPLALSLMDM